MKFNPRLKADVEKYFDYSIIVEGKKDVSLLKSLGFQKVYAIHEQGIPVAERINHLSQVIEKKEKVCILTDFDKRGKTLYFEIKDLCQQFNIKTDSTLRGILLVSDMGHLEELKDFVKKSQGEMTHKKKHWEIR